MTEQEPEDGGISQQLAAALTAALGLQDLFHIRQYYPGVLGDTDAKELFEAFGAHLRKALEDGRIDVTRGDPLLGISLDDPSTAGYATALGTLLLMRCPNIRKGETDTDVLLDSVKQAVADCREAIPSSMKGIVEHLLEIKLYDCRIPTGHPIFKDRRRTLQLLRSYWSLCRKIVLRDMRAPVRRYPHPLQRIVLNLRARMETYFGRLSDVEGARDAFAVAANLADAVVGRPLELSHMPQECVHREIAKVDVFLESVRLRSGSKIFSLTHEEETFLEMAELAISYYHKGLQSIGRRVLADAQASLVAKAMNPTQLSEAVRCARKKPPRKRAERAAAIDALKKALRNHLRSARGHAQSCIDMGKPAELLPRPTQKQLAEELGLSRSTVCRAVHDKNDKELQLLWQGADDLGYVRRFRGR